MLLLHLVLNTYLNHHHPPLEVLVVAGLEVVFAGLKKAKLALLASLASGGKWLAAQKAIFR